MDENEIRQVISALDDAIEKIQELGDRGFDAQKQIDARSLLFSKVP